MQLNVILILETFSLTVNPETNWFDTCRDSNLEIIGPMLGHYLRTRAEHFCRNLSNASNNHKKFESVGKILSICDEAVSPCVVELTVAERIAKQLEKFVHLSDDVTRAVDGAVTERGSRKMVIHEIKPEFHDWAWSCLNTGDMVPLTKSLASSSSQGSVLAQTVTSESSVSVTRPLKTRCGRTVKINKKFE